MGVEFPHMDLGRPKPFTVYGAMSFVIGCGVCCAPSVCYGTDKYCPRNTAYRIFETALKLSDERLLYINVKNLPV
jgi:hypothetical protein